MKKILLLLAITFFLGCSSTPTPKTELDAYIFAENFVEKGLKSPSSAKFPSPKEKKSHVSKLSKNVFSIDSWVESQNSFGAMIKTKFSCKIIFDDEKETVSCEDLKFEQQ